MAAAAAVAGTRRRARDASSDVLYCYRARGAVDSIWKRINIYIRTKWQTTAAAAGVRVVPEPLLRVTRDDKKKKKKPTPGRVVDDATTRLNFLHALQLLLYVLLYYNV